MILDNTAIRNIIINRPNQKLLTSVQKYTKKLLMHIKGIGLAEYIEQINMFEKQDLITIRKKYAVSNKHLFERLHRPKDNIYSANGGSVYYDMPDNKKGTFIKQMNNLIYGFTIKQWLKTYFTPAQDYDPMGLIFIEVDENGKAYPTYKSVLDIYDYQLNGRELEYVVFKTDIKITKAGVNGVVYRVVDDVSDKLIQVVGNNVTEIKGQTFPNYFMRVPALVISNIYDPVQGFWVSGDDSIVELADQYLHQGSVKNIYKNYFGFPRAWEYGSSCPECKGEGVLDGRSCTYCKGTGQKSRTDVSETIRIPVPQNKDSVKLAPEVAGYITPDIEGWKQMNEEEKAIEDLMNQTLWGTHQVESGDNNTATGKFIDVQPVNNALCSISESTETMEAFITDLIGEFYFKGAYKGSSITYGKRYIFESPDELWKKLQDGIKNGAPISSLYDIYKDYLCSRYNSHSLEMQKQLKLASIEPLPFATYAELAAIVNFPQNILLRKYWYEGWMNSKEDQELTYGDKIKLQQDFDAYCELQEKKLPTVESVEPANKLVTA